MADKKIRIREAKPRDTGLFRKLWKAYLESNEKAGSAVCPTDKNIIGPEGLFARYVKDPSVEGWVSPLDGVVLFVADYAIFMAGQAGTNIDYNCGKVANLWGVYVQPGKDVGDQLVAEGLKRLKEKGFDTVLFTCTSDAAIQIPNAKPLFVTVKIPLE